MRAPEAVTTTTVAANVRRLGENCTNPSAPDPRHNLIDFFLTVSQEQPLSGAGLLGVHKREQTATVSVSAVKVL